MPIHYTSEQDKILEEVEKRNAAQGLTNYHDGDASQATIQILSLDIQPDIGEKVYEVLLRDPQNLDEPVAMSIHVFSDGAAQAMEVKGAGEIMHAYGIEP